MPGAVAEQRWRLAGRHRAAALALGLPVLLALGLAALALPDATPPLGGIASAAWTLLTAGGLAALYLLGAAGWGWVAAPMVRGPDQRWLCAGLGVGIALGVDHLLGWLGVLNSALAWGATALGIVALALTTLRARRAASADGTRHPPRTPWDLALLLACVPVGVMLLAACSPPGWLWESEAGGFDVLSYHLQLPKEWVERGRLEPLEHNVYSFLPSYAEAGYLHVIMLARPAMRLLAPAPGGLPWMIAGQGEVLAACQLVHAGMAVLAGLMAVRLVCRLGERAGLGRESSALGAAIAGASLLATPWTVVTGSMAYNEMAVVLLGLTATLAAVGGPPRPAAPTDPVVASDPAITGSIADAARRGAAAGLALGLASSAKPTALFLVGPLVGLLLALPVRGALHAPEQRAHALHRALTAWFWAGVLGLAAVAPWLLRNKLACGNPVFPALTAMWGQGHWTAEQVARFAAAHRESAGLVTRLGLLLSPDGLGAGSARGVLHEQWSVFWPAAALLLLTAVLTRATRRAALALALGSALGLSGWLFLTHLQSRFLVPLLVGLVPLLGLGGAAIAGRAHRPWAARAAPVILALLPLALGGHTLRLFLAQREARPNLFLTGMAGVISGAAAASTSPEEALRFLEDAPPPAFWNLRHHAGMPHLSLADPAPPARLYLLGESRALYFAGPLVYHTTWDTSPLGRALAKSPDDPAAWTAELRHDGITHVLVNYAELARLAEVDRWYAPGVTPGVVDRWLGGRARVVKSWGGPGGATVLYELR
ncbi:MAG TPA: hypothetical protein VD963_02730 [Phycisphaerales bacterium]|nr:hypothetical protein [Phycisphaerales bacterium]